MYDEIQLMRTNLVAMQEKELFYQERIEEFTHDMKRRAEVRRACAVRAVRGVPACAPTLPLSSRPPVHAVHGSAVYEIVSLLLQAEDKTIGAVQQELVFLKQV